MSQSPTSIYAYSLDRCIDPFSVDFGPDDVVWADIAHALAGTMRFRGGLGTRCWLSVAEHSVHVAEKCSPEHALYGLLHDAAEAYLTDVPRPQTGSIYIAQGPEVSEYAAIHDRVLGVILAKAGLDPVIPSEVLRIDDRMAATEINAYCGAGFPRGGLAEPYPGRGGRAFFTPEPPAVAQKSFLRALYGLLRIAQVAP